MHSSGSRRNPCSAQCCLASSHRLGCSRVRFCLFSLLCPTVGVLPNNSKFLGSLSVPNLCHKKKCIFQKGCRGNMKLEKQNLETYTGKRERILFQGTESENKIRETLWNADIILEYLGVMVSSAETLVIMGKQESYFKYYFIRFEMAFYYKLVSMTCGCGWRIVGDSGCVWQLRIRRMRKIYLCSGVCWIRGRVKCVTETAAKLSGCLSFQQWCWDMKKYKTVNLLRRGVV